MGTKGASIEYQGEDLVEIQGGKKKEDKGFRTPMQWMWTEDGEEIRGVSTVECSGIWPDIAEIKKRLEKGYRRHQKIKKTSEPLAGLPK